MLIEAAWSYRFSARVAREQLQRQERPAKPIRDIAWKAQERLCRQYRKLSRATTMPCLNRPTLPTDNPAAAAAARTVMPSARARCAAFPLSDAAIGRPMARPVRVPFWRALAMPAFTRSTMIARSNSAKTPSI
jgi:hypothetical protein